MAYREDLFTFVVNQLNAGMTQKELSEKMNELVQECRKTGKKGDLTLKIGVKPDSGDTGQYFLTTDIKISTPKMERGKTLMWGTPDGNLQRHDPAQSEMDLKVVREELKDPRFLTDPTQEIKKV